MAAKSKKTAAVESKESTHQITTKEREAWIAQQAYYLAEARGFAPGEEMADWLQAEQQFASRMGLG